MTRVVLAAVALAALPLSSIAQETSIHLHVRPMRAPKPALKYQLLPELGELNPGNSAHNYLKCFMEQHNFFFSKEAVVDRNRFETMPLADLPLDKVRNYGGGALRQADWAARMDNLDWQSLSSTQDGGIDTLPGEVGPLQVLGKALHVRFRGEVAERHFDDAIRTAKTMFALSRHLGEHPSEVGNLVGLWVAHVALNTLEEMVQQPGCPNLYWALSDLPSPLVDLRRGVQGNRTLMTALLKLIRDDGPMTESELEQAVSRLSGLMNFAREQAGQSPRSLRARLQSSAKDSDMIRIARRRLVEAGAADVMVKKYPTVQVILLDQKREYELERDERLKLLALPLWQTNGVLGGKECQRAGDGLFADLLPIVGELRREQAALEQQIALLRHVEGLRIYAAEHEGKLPAGPADIPVPLPLDPVTGKPFGYSVEATTAHLSGGSLSSKDQSTTPNVKYRVTILK